MAHATIDISRNIEQAKKLNSQADAIHSKNRKLAIAKYKNAARLLQKSGDNEELFGELQKKPLLYVEFFKVEAYSLEKLSQFFYADSSYSMAWSKIKKENIPLTPQEKGEFAEAGIRNALRGLDQAKKLTSFEKLPAVSVGAGLEKMIRKIRNSISTHITSTSSLADSIYNYAKMLPETAQKKALKEAEFKLDSFMANLKDINMDQFEVIRGLKDVSERIKGATAWLG